MHYAISLLFPYVFYDSETQTYVLSEKPMCYPKYALSHYVLLEFRLYMSSRRHVSRITFVVILLAKRQVAAVATGDVITFAS